MLKCFFNKINGLKLYFLSGSLKRLRNRLPGCSKGQLLPKGQGAKHGNIADKAGASPARA